MKEQIGHRVKLARKQAHLTQEELAEKSGLSASFISRLETGQALPGIEGLCNIAKALDIGLQDLLCDLFTSNHDSVKSELFSNIELMPPVAQAHLLAYIKLMKQFFDEKE